MAKKNGKKLIEQKKALAEALKKIEKCRRSHSKTLEIGHNGYLNVFPQEIRKLTWLTNLSIICTDIKVLPDWIGELGNLKTLNLYLNQKIKKLPRSIANLKQLKKLILDNTGVKKLPSFIGELSSLELLDISMYGIKEVPQCILDLPKLKRIETGGYKIGHLPSLVAKQHDLNVKELFRRIERCRKQKSKKLDLSCLYLGELSKDFSDLKWLEELNLMNNDLKQLPDWIGNFPKLTMLDLCGNELTSLPDSIGKLSKLKRIDLGSNRLQTLPETFGNLKSLEEFELLETHNHPALEAKWGQGSWFSRLPDSFGNLSSLKSFFVSDTRLTGLPESFGNLKSLRVLWIQECMTRDFYFPASMKNLTALEELGLSALDRLPDFIGELKNLTRLDISHNKLEVLPDFIGNLKKLKTLNLHSTWIMELPVWVGNLKNLVELDITNNGILTDPQIEKKLPKLKRFSDSYNDYSIKSKGNK